MIRQTDRRFGPTARDRLAQANLPTIEGAYAALESFYYALNQRDLAVLAGVWADHPLAQLNNPLGGILRGGDAVTDLYAKIFHGPVRVEVTFGDIVEYLDDRHAVFAGRETGAYSGPNARRVPLEIRTTRYFRYEGGRWRQYHHTAASTIPTPCAPISRRLRAEGDVPQ